MWAGFGCACSTCEDDFTGEAGRELTANPIKAMTSANSTARIETDHLQHSVQFRRLPNPDWVNCPIGVCMTASFEGGIH